MHYGSSTWGKKALEKIFPRIVIQSSLEKSVKKEGKVPESRGLGKCVKMQKLEEIISTKPMWTMLASSYWNKGRSRKARKD